MKSLFQPTVFHQAYIYMALTCYKLENHATYKQGITVQATNFHFEYKQQYQFELIYCQLPWILSSN